MLLSLIESVPEIKPILKLYEKWKKYFNIKMSDLWNKELEYLIMEHNCVQVLEYVKVK